MANTIQEEIYKNFLEVSRRQAGRMTAVTQSLADLIRQAGSVRKDMAEQNVPQPQTGSMTQGAPSLADVILQADAVRQDMAQQNARLADPYTASSAARRASGSTTTASGSTQAPGGTSALSTVLDVFKSG